MRQPSRLFMLAALCLCSVIAGAAASPWTKKFEGSNYGAFFDAALTPDGNVVVVGATNHLHVPPYSGDSLLMKLTLDGDIIWEQNWGGDGYEQAWAVASVPGDGFLIFGETDSFGAGDRDFFLLKVSDEGTEEWVKMYGGAHREWPYGMLPLSNGDFLLHGFTTVESGSRRQYAVRVSAQGDPLWEYVAGDAGEEIILDALETATGEIILCLSIDEDGGIAKLDANGNVLWTRRYELAGWQFSSAIASINDGGFLLAGFSMTEGVRRQVDTWLVRCDASGEIQWETSFGDPTRDDYAQVLLRLDDGTYLVGGLGIGMPLWRIDSNGNVLSSQLLTGSHICAVKALLALEDGNFLAAGMIQIRSGRSYDAIVLRADMDG